MSLNELIISELSVPEEWNSFLEHYSRSCLLTIAHNPSLGMILDKTFMYNTIYYTIKKNQKLVGVIPVSYIGEKAVSVPHFSYGDIVFIGDMEEKYQIRELLFKKKYMIRSFEIFSKYYDDSKVMSYLELNNDCEILWNGWKSKLKSQIRKGIKNGVSVMHGGIEYLEIFYKIYARNMRDLGSPVLTKQLFKNILQNIKYGSATIFIGKYEDTYVAGSFVITYQNYAEVCWASSLRRYNFTGANMVLYWDMIRHYTDLGLKYFSFGRSSHGSSTWRFKKQWNPKEKVIISNYSEMHRIKKEKFKWLSLLWRKLPLIIANFVGPHISKRIY